MIALFLMLPVAIFVILATGAPAGAHSFLVSTSPGQGERLETSPDLIVLEFSEAVDPITMELGIRDARGRPVKTAPPQIGGGGLSIQSSMPPLDEGIYVVTWQAFSDVDGHGNLGEHSFGVGDVTKTLPAATSSSSSGRWGTAASWLFFAGFAAAAGSLVVQWLDGATMRWGRLTVRVGLVTALAGALVSWVDRIQSASSSGVVLASLSAVLVALAMSAHGLVRRPGIPLGLLLLAAVSWSGRSHAASIAGLAGGVADAVHLAAGGIWVGALVTVVVRLWREGVEGEDPMSLVRRYSRPALGLVVVLASAGVVSAFQLVPTWAAVWSTGYGQLLVAKTLLFGMALVLAGVGRWGGIRRRRVRVLQRSTTAEGTVVVMALVVAGLLANISPPVPASTAETLLGPPPFEGPVARDAGLAGQLNVEVTRDGRRIDIRVFSPSGPVPGTEVAAVMTAPDGTEADLLPRPCGPGCFTQELAPVTGSTSMSVTARAPEWTGGVYEASIPWPPGPLAATRLDEVLVAMRAVPALTVLETVDSGPGSHVVEQRIKLSGVEFVAAEPYAGGNVADVRAVPGQPERLTLYVPGSQIFAVLVLDGLGRIASSRLISPGHEIARTFIYPSS